MKNSKYLKYALGEILLVMVGILLAFQVSKWSEDIKNRREEAFYYSKLRENISQDTLNLQLALNRLESSIVNIDAIFEEFKTKNDEKLDGDIASALIRVESYNPETTTWDNLIATGKISLIRNQVVIDSLTNYYNQYILSTRQWLEASYTYSRNHLGPYMLQFDDIMLDFGDEEMGKFERVFEPQQKSVRAYKSEVFIRNAAL